MMRETLRKIRKDFNAALSMDPAATSKIEVALTYAGFHALLFYRLAHWLVKRRIPFPSPRFVQFARFLTGIEIHPAQPSDQACSSIMVWEFVIGETSEIGDNVTLFQG